MTPVDFHPEARADFDKSFDWYADRSPTAAGNFSNSVDDALVRIVKAPEQFPFVDGRHRECLLRKFPFRVIFRIESNCILVVAVAHAKRRPSFWRGRG